MKKTLTLIAAATLSALSFASWADTLTVGASNTPHAEILEQAKPILAKQVSIWRSNRSALHRQIPRWRAATSMPTISSTSRI